jgi:hypothetical protein
MPVAVVTPVLAAGFLPMFVPETSPSTTQASADAWAKAYVAYVVAGGIPAASAKQVTFANALASAFNPNLAGGGPALFLSAMLSFWVGLPVPAQVGVVTLFLPVSPSVNSPQPDNATPQQQANGLAQVISGLTLGAVKVQLTAPPFTVLPLL